MKSIGNLLKATILGGLFVLLPVVIIFRILSGVMQMAVAVATPIADLFPEGAFDKVPLPTVVAIVLIIGVSFLLGVLMLAWPGRALGSWVERQGLIEPLNASLAEVTKVLGHWGVGTRDLLASTESAHPTLKPDPQ